MIPIVSRTASALLALVLLTAASGCSRYYWSKAGATPEQFTRDSGECGQQAAGTLPPGATVEAVEQFYRACLNSRGYVRASQLDPPPAGSYRGIEDTEQFAALSRTSAAAQRQRFEQQLAQLDDLKERGRITPEEYATMRRRLVEGATPASLAPAPAAVTAAPTAADASLAGRWYGRGDALLDIRHTGPADLEALAVPAGARKGVFRQRARHQPGVRNRHGLRGQGLARRSPVAARHHPAHQLRPHATRQRAARRLARAQQPARHRRVHADPALRGRPALPIC